MIKTQNARVLPSGFLIAIFQELTALVCRGLFRLGGGYTVNMHLNGRLGHRQRYVIAANHQSMLDPFAIFSLFTAAHRFEVLPLKFMTIPKVYHRFYVKPFAYLLGCFPAHIRERNHHTYGIDGSIKLLGYGYNICIFPEGTRTTQADSNPKPGVCRILQEYPDAKLLLARIDWSRGPLFRRHITLTVASASENINKNDPNSIMKAIYRL